MTPQVCSFDVFDTCLVRTVATGAELLARAARAVVADGPHAEELVGEAVRLRLVGEQRATADGRDAVLLDEAYEAVRGELQELGIDAGAMRDVELALERDGLRPVAATRRRIDAVRAAGTRVVFVSDMHLPGSLLREVLEREGLARPGDGLYVSGELGLSKLTGRLYDHVLAQEGLRPEQMLHRGDDAWTDLHMAGTRGVPVDPFPQGRLNRYERLVHGRAAADRSTAAGLAGVSRAARLHESSSEAAAVLGATVGADVVGPLLTGYVRWLLSDARRRGVATLCFVSRDGQVLHEIALRVREPGDPECRYVYGSRQAWFRAGVASDVEGDLGWVFEPLHERATVRSVLAKLGLEPHDVTQALADLGLGADDPVDPGAPGACAVLVERVRPQVQTAAGRARDLLRTYLEQEGLLDGRPWALVDVGWYLNAQLSLRQALGAHVPMSGYYLAVRAGRRPWRDTGPYRARVREDLRGERDVLEAGWLLDVPNLVEHVFVRADHGQCVGYEQQGDVVVPLLRDPRPAPAWYPALRAATLRFAELACGEGLLSDDGAAAFAAGDVAGRAFALEPTREEALLFGGTLVSDDQNEAGLRPLAPPLSVDDLVLRARRKLGRVEDGPGFWQHWGPGTWAATPRSVQTAVTVARAAAPAARAAVPVARRLVGRVRDAGSRSAGRGR